MSFQLLHNMISPYLTTHQKLHPIVQSKFLDNLNPGTTLLGIDACAKLIELTCATYPDCPIISIGSGTAILEAIYTIMTGRHIICVDSNPMSFCSNNLKEPFLAPKYKNVEELIQHKPKYVGNCIVLLIWCSPHESACDDSSSDESTSDESTSDESTSIESIRVDSIYDVQAIELLNPISFVTLADFDENKNGCAGGEKFFKFLQTQETKEATYRLVHAIAPDKMINQLFHNRDYDYNIHCRWYEKLLMLVPKTIINDEVCKELNAIITQRKNDIIADLKQSHADFKPNIIHSFNLICEYVKIRNQYGSGSPELMDFFSSH